MGDFPDSQKSDSLAKLADSSVKKHELPTLPRNQTHLAGLFTHLPDRTPETS